MIDLYRLVYTSRNLVGGEEERRRASIASMVEASRRNNGRSGVTGALLLGSDGFAQVLEGPRAAVEATFERIQRDARHGDIHVLRGEPVADRMFPEWSTVSVKRPVGGRADRDGLAGDAGFDLGRVDGDGLCAALLAMVRTGPGNALDVERLRSALVAERPDLRAASGQVGTTTPKPSQSSWSEATGLPLRPTPASRPTPSAAPAPLPPAAGCDAEQRTLRLALDAERERTTASRRDLDEAHIALARAGEEAEALERDRDIWADRSSQLRASLKRAGEALLAAETERDALRERVASGEGRLDALRLERDIWADRARALSAAFCRDPVPSRDEAAATEVARPSPERGRATSIRVAR